ncbi:hypothetical protein CEXT_568911 [Caerostris extrusa]|uniref:Uncharacterized protein n=1 Tax=Caerostris extrusa TaxID=172846 RepID=A0AAV4Y5I8_CAEEX|nr:hypothetical protein CEXT_568911 [Caerostris extrusa]
MILTQHQLRRVHPPSPPPRAQYRSAQCHSDTLNARQTRGPPGLLFHANIPEQTNEEQKEKWRYVFQTQ